MAQKFRIDQSRKIKLFAYKVKRYLKEEMGRRWVKERKTEELVRRLELLEKSIY